MNYFRKLGLGVVAFGYIVNSPRVLAEDQLSNTTWKTPFVGDPQGIQQQTTRKFDGAGTLTESTKLMINHPLFHGAQKYDMVLKYLVTGSSEAVAGGMNIDYEFVKVLETALDDQTATQNNSHHECGYTDWEVGVPKDVTGIACDENHPEEHMPAAGIKDYSIYKIENDKIYFGDDDIDNHRGETPETRVDTLDMTKVFTRQLP